MYVGSTLNFLGAALLSSSPAGLFLTGVVYCSYQIAIQFEGNSFFFFFFKKKNNNKSHSNFSINQVHSLQKSIKTQARIHHHHHRKQHLLHHQRKKQRKMIKNNKSLYILILLICAARALLECNCFTNLFNQCFQKHSDCPHILLYTSIIIILICLDHQLFQREWRLIFESLFKH